MKLCLPALVTLAIFTALIILDIVNKDTKQIGFHFGSGFASVLGLAVICNYLGEHIGWILLSIPFIFLLIGFLLIWIDQQKETPLGKPSCPQKPRACPCLACRRCPCSCGLNIPPPPTPAPPPCAGPLRSVS